MTIYLASPFFNDKEIKYVEKVEIILRDRGFEVFSPREHEVRDEETGSPIWANKIFKMDRDAIDDCDVVVAIYHGNYSDSGTAWECGYASGKNIPVVIIHVGENSNLMIHESSRRNINIDMLKEYDFTSLPESIYQGKMF